MDADSQQKGTESEAEQVSGLLVLVANVTEFRLWTDPHTGEKELRRGTKPFSPGTKVYCDHPIGFFQWDAEFGAMRVLGRHRKSKRWVCSVTKVACLTNFRVKVEYNPHIQQLLTDIYGFGIVANDRFGREELDKMAVSGNATAAHVADRLRRYTEEAQPQDQPDQY